MGKSVDFHADFVDYVDFIDFKGKIDVFPGLLTVN